MRPRPRARRLALSAILAFALSACLEDAVDPHPPVPQPDRDGGHFEPGPHPQPPTNGGSGSGSGSGSGGGPLRVDAAPRDDAEGPDAGVDDLDAALTGDAHPNGQ